MHIPAQYYQPIIPANARQLVVVIGGEAIPQSRPKISVKDKYGCDRARPIAYYKDASIYYRQQCEYCIQNAIRKNNFYLENTAIFCEVYFFVPIPKSKSKKFTNRAAAGLEIPMTKPDNDNVYKNITDAAEKIAFDSDSRIASTHIHKRYTDGQPFAVLILTEMQADLFVIPSHIKQILQPK